MAQTLGPGTMGWNRLHSLPSFTNEVKGEINILDEMNVQDSAKYYDKDGKVRQVLMHNYPEKCISKFSNYRGSEAVNRQGILVDTREYKTPYPWNGGDCRVVSQIIWEDGTIKPMKAYIPSIFAQKMGWKRGDGRMIPIEEMPKVETPPDLAVEIHKEAKRRAKEGPTVKVKDEQTTI